MMYYCYKGHIWNQSDKLNIRVQTLQWKMHLIKSCDYSEFIFLSWLKDWTCSNNKEFEQEGWFSAFLI